MVFELVYCRVPPPNEMVPDEPIAFAEPRLSVPSLMSTPPEKLLLPEIVKTPEPVFISLPLPEIVFDTVWALELLKVIL